MGRGRPSRFYGQEPATLEGKLDLVGFSNVAKNLETLIAEAAQNNLSHRDFLDCLIERELVWRHGKKVDRLVHCARFPVIKTIDGFDWDHPTNIPKALILNALKFDFVEKKEHLIFLGPGGVGKSHLALAIGYAACQKEIPVLFTTVADMINDLVAAQADHSLKRVLMKYIRPKLLLLDELGYLPLDEQGRNLFFQVISKRAQTGSVVLTTNKPFKNWNEVFQDTAVATAIAERLVENGELIKIEGSSYRVKKRRARQLGFEGPDNK
jgi:DNA replication protein DnaC